MVANIHYRWDFIGLSTDTKPTPASSEKVVDGSTYYCSDNSKLYVWYKDQWYEKTVSGGGGGTDYTAGDGIDITNDVIKATNTGKARVLTSADYNWPTGNPTSVALWLMDPGIYINSNSVNVKMHLQDATNSPCLYFVAPTMSPTSKIVIKTGNENGGDEQAFNKYTVRTDTGASSNYVKLAPPIDNLTSNSGSSVLSANQGRVLKNLVDSLAIRGAGAPTTSTVGQVGTLYEDTTNGDLYICTDATNPYVWVEVGAGGGGSGVIELTSADYNWPIASPDGVALWLLEPGMYYAKSVQVYMSGNEIADITNQGTFIVGDDSTSAANPAKLILYYNQITPAAYLISTIISSGNRSSKNSLLSPTVNQATGTSTTQVMSQNATTSMIYADPATKNRLHICNGATGTGSRGIAIGVDSNSGASNDGIAIGFMSTSNSQSGIAIGYSSYVPANKTGSVALGSGASVTYPGEVNIGAGNTSYGYNSSNYRLLTGLYDPQSAHDAATKGYVDPTTDSSAPTTATVGRLGQIQIDTTNADAYMCVAVDSVTPSYTWKKINV